MYLYHKIYATSFYSNKSTPDGIENMAYDKDALRRDKYAAFAALPYSWAKQEPALFKKMKSTGRFPVVIPYYKGLWSVLTVMDVGPWNINDPYWAKARRPMAEEQFAAKIPAQNGLVPTQTAGADFTPGGWMKLGVPEKQAFSGNFSAFVDLVIVVPEF